MTGLSTDIPLDIEHSQLRVSILVLRANTRKVSEGDNAVIELP